MSVYSQSVEIEGIIGRLCDNLLLMVRSRSGPEGSALRRQVGILRSDLNDLIIEKKLPNQILACFTAAREAKVTLNSLTNVRKKLMLENPIGPLATSIVQSSIVLCLSTESRIAAEIEFTSRDDVEAMLARMKTAFDAAKEMAADEMDSASYQQLTYLAGAVTQHLATTARPLPRMIRFLMTDTMPALTVSHRIYRDTERWDELVKENKIVHPAFCLRSLRGLAT